MRVALVAAEGFRNLSPFRLETSARFNIFEGANGQGKTNLLEVVYLLASFRSHRDARNSELIAFGSERATLHAEIDRLDVRRTV